MKNLPIILAILFFVTASALVGTSLFAPKPMPEALIISPRERDLGQLRPSIVSCEFDITNGLPYDVDLVAIQKSCGCTTASADKTLLRQRETAHITASIDLKGRAGAFASHLTIVYRQAHVADSRIQVTACAAYANVDPIVHLTSQNLVFNEGQEATDEIGISFTDVQYNVVKVTSDHSAFHADLSKDSTKVMVRFDPKLWGEHNGVPGLTIWTTCPFENRIRVPLIVRQTTVRPPTSRLTSEGWNTF